MRILVGDIGGTHARLALAECDGDDCRLTRKEAFPSSEYGGLEAVVLQFLDGVDGRPERASFGVACPVVEGVCELPNLDWVLRQEAVAEEIGIPRTRLINDFDAVCHALPRLGDEDLVTLQEGRERSEPSPLAVIGAGTGLGQGFVTWEDGEPRVHASEGGHVDFAPRTPTECRLLEHLRQEYGRVSYERVLSGPGLVNVYRFLVASDPDREREETRRAVEEDGAAVISERALEGDDPVCEEALDIFVSLYGAQAGNLALTVQATGGVFVAGGIAPKILEKLQDGTFMGSFRNKGRFAGLMGQIPVRVVTNPDVGLLGAAAAAVS